MVYKSVLDLIGNTPLVEISKDIHNLKNVNLYAKLEIYNPFGSVKDRTAYAMLKDHIDEIKKNNMTVIESSSGNTAKALKLLCNINNIDFETVTNRIKIPEVKDILKSFGTNIKELPGLSECPDPNNPNDALKIITKMMIANPGKYFYPDQYTNPNNPSFHYHTTGKEIWNDLGKVDYFFGTLGTAGSSGGIVKYIKEQNPYLKAYGIVGEKGDFIPGIRNMDEMFEVGNFDLSLYDEIVNVSTSEALDSMFTLVNKCGILGGPTSGACLAGAIKFLSKIDKDLKEEINVVMVICDRVEHYMSYIKKRRPELFYEEPKDNIYTLTTEDNKYLKQVKVEELDNFIKEEKPLIIDLRGNLAYRNSHIKGSMNILESIFLDVVDNAIIFDKYTTVLLICPTGKKSDKFAMFLNKKGMNVYSLEGGMIELINNSYPLERISNYE